MKLLKRVLIALFATIILADFLLTFATIPKVWAAEGDVLVSDDFSDGNLDGWTIQYGNWYINPQGNIAGSNSGLMLGGKINTGNSEWDNYRIDLDINGFQGIDGGVGFRYTPNGNSYELNLRFEIDSYNTPEAILRKTEDGVTTIIGDNHSLTLIGQKWYHLTIEVSNENIKIWINNGLIFDITDTGTKVKKGTLTLSYWTGDIGVAYMKFDNVVVTALAPPPPPKTAVIFIPGIGGSELKASQDIFWEQPDGHGGTYSHAYGANEKIWVNQDKATELGDDDYFDVLRLKTDGVTSAADLSLTGNLTPFGYTDIDSFFTGMGYVKGTNFFIFPYDWRKDVRSNKDSLDSLIEQAKTTSSQSKVNLVVHSMGGLVARYYISDSSKASKVNKLIELGVPHLGTVESLKLLVYGLPLGKPIFKIFNIGIAASEAKDVYQNFPSGFQLLPSNQYFTFYNNSDKDHPYPFRDDRDIDNDKVTGDLNYSQIKNLLSNQSYNMTVFGIGEQFHNSLDPTLNQNNGTKIYEIVGTAEPTLGQIHETWWITWPVNLIPKTDEIYINGDETVPFYSASLKSSNLDLSGGATIYSVEQKHGDLVSASGTAMQIVKAILNDDNVEVKSVKIDLEGEQLSLDDGELELYDDEGKHTGIKDNGEMETNIPETFYSTSGKTKHAFVKKKAAKVKVKITKKKPAANSKTTNLKKRTYKADKISKTIIFKDISISDKGKVEFNLDPKVDTSPSLTFYPDETKPDNTSINPTSEVSGDSALDQTAPTTKIAISGTKNSSGIYTGPVTITLTGTDSGSGILRIEYSLDNGQTVQIYSGPFTISTSGKTTIQIKSIDKLGNEEIPQTITIEIAVPPSPTPTSSTSNSSTSDTSSSDTNRPSTTSDVIARSEATRQSISSPPSVLGIEFKNPSHISDQINVDHTVDRILDQQKNSNPASITQLSSTQILGGLLLVFGGIVTLASLVLIITFSPWNLFFRGRLPFVKPFPK